MQMHHLYWDPRVLDNPFYDSQGASLRGQTCPRSGSVLFADTLDCQQSMTSELRGFASLVKLRLTPPTALPCFPAPALTDNVDTLYSTAQRMKHGGHLNAGTHRNHYQPNNPGTDGQDAYLVGQLHTLVADLFRGMTVSHNPNPCGICQRRRDMKFRQARSYRTGRIPRGTGG